MHSAVQTALEQIIKYEKQEGKKEKKSSILLLGRFNFDGDRLARTGLFEYISRGSKVKSVKYPDLDITFMTAHASKGLGYDNVIVINGRNETYGFPAKIEDDPVLSLVIRDDRSMQYAEERRLFYVAMTRTRTECISLHRNRILRSFYWKLNGSIKMSFCGENGQKKKRRYLVNINVQFVDFPCN